MMTVTFEPITLTISVVAILIALWQGVIYITKRNVEHLFNKKIETHKHELQKIMEFNKFDFQRKFQDFSLYTAKKHDHYQKIYNLFLISEGKAKSFIGLRTVPDYITMNSKQLKYSLKKSGIPEVMFEDYLNDWDKTKNSIVQELKDRINKYEISSAQSALTEAKNEYLLSRLYLSDKVIDICNNLSKAIGLYLIDVESIYDLDYPSQERKVLSRSIEENSLIIEKSLAELRGQMIEEIGIGYY